MNSLSYSNVSFEWEKFKQISWLISFWGKETGKDMIENGILMEKVWRDCTMFKMFDYKENFYKKNLQKLLSTSTLSI